jgi:hypothetical protein
MIDERTAAAAILGELIPQLEYAAPVLLERLDCGEPLVERKSPSELGFDTGMIDPQLLELFRALAPYVTAALSCGLLGILQKQSQAESRAALAQIRTENAELRRMLDSIRGALSSAANASVAQSYVDEAIESARALLSQSQR